ncbi:MAG: hypothetical protein BHW62_07180 [Acinetobacter sp. CAG:196_36_41]|nr:MAG: hypothetical protein BHW62_07180 [Acinetobacter sp. CAG:196_36_41]
MKICFIPIDNRPVCYNLAKDIAAIDESVELFIPPREFLGDLTRSAGVNEIIEWIENIPECDAMVISLDTIAYGGLIPSRRSTDSLEDIKSRLKRLKPSLKNKKVYAFSSIMRISNNNYNEEEKEYWKDWGKKIFEYSYSGVNDGIPQAILDDYLATRKRNFEINKTYLNWGLNTLIFSKDDCASKGFNVDEARELERLGAKTKTGADEIPLTLLARAIEKEIKVFVEFTEPDYKDCISNYEDVSIEKSVQGQLELGGFTQVQTREEADVILIVNNFIEKQGEYVMGWTTQPFRKTFTPPDKPYAIADVRYANGADNDFVEQLLPQIDLKNFYGYAGWNTSANTIGSLLAGVKVRWNAGKYNESAFKRLQIIRFLDDWAYQANVRGMIENPCDIQALMKPYEIKLAEIFGQIPPIEYLYPWSRKFEVEISI